MVETLAQRLRAKVGLGGLQPSLQKCLPEWRNQLRDCAHNRGGEISARRKAAALVHTYLGLDDVGRHAFLKLISLEFGPDPKQVASANADYQEAIGTNRQWDAESELRAVLRSPRMRIMTLFNAAPQGVKFLVDLRADLLRYVKTDIDLQALDRELQSRLGAWFDIGFLELQRITWQSSAVLLEKFIEYEAVHEIRSWSDLKNRLDSDRRLYAFFHPRMPLEPLIFVEVALTNYLADCIPSLLDEHAPVFDAQRADTAIFYSISNTQPGLRGVSFGNFLLKRVIDDLRRDFPRLKTFATLSPIPGLSKWIARNPGALKANGITSSESELSNGTWALEPKLARALSPQLARLAARYLTQAKINTGESTQPDDPVSRFHLGNGARIERINNLGDPSAKGMKQSFGLMVNYLYDLDVLEENIENFAREGCIATSATVRRQAR